ncbi:hypothetical protein L916_12613 [Phytophthora nicotianae]|uniref:Uncharacterized protein n=1 Tax=Phytophthora nicotianae TaxID=4792 RepID=W2IPC0_PHYNI|nr:hypothetical protein L916_12613 [Phytophthora nicotianae]
MCVLPTSTVTARREPTARCWTRACTDVRTVLLPMRPRARLAVMAMSRLSALLAGITTAALTRTTSASLR